MIMGTELIADVGDSDENNRLLGNAKNDVSKVQQRGGGSIDQAD